MNNISRVFATGFIWAALTILGVGIMVSHATNDGGALVFMVSVLIIGATIATSAVWKSDATHATALEHAEKTKRRSRVERMMDNLSESDMDELRYRLMNTEHNEDPVTLETLLYNDKNR